MGKEKRKGPIEIEFPLPYLFVLLIFFTAVMVYPIFAPPPGDGDRLVKLRFVFVFVVFLFSAPAVIFNWPFHPRCSLSYRTDHRVLFGKLWARDIRCGKPSIGRIKVVKNTGDNARWQYFCKYCDPEKQYFQKLLCHRYANVFINSMVLFSIIEKERGNEDGRDDDDIDSIDR